MHTIFLKVAKQHKSLGSALGALGDIDVCLWLSKVCRAGLPVQGKSCGPAVWGALCEQRLEA